jgi:hypothetical protein
MAVGTEDDLERCGPVIADALRPSRRVSEVQRRKLGLDSVSDALAERGIVDDGEINHDLVVDQGGHGFPPETKVLDEHACFGACGPGVSGAGHQGEQFEVRSSVAMAELAGCGEPGATPPDGFLLGTPSVAVQLQGPIRSSDHSRPH